MTLHPKEAVNVLAYAFTYHNNATSGFDDAHFSLGGVHITKQFKDNFLVYVLEKASDDYTLTITVILLALVASLSMKTDLIFVFSGRRVFCF